MSKFRFELESKGAVDKLELIGVIDVDSELGSIANKLEGEQLIIDAGEVERMTPIGVEGWSELLESVRSRGAVVALSRCSSAVVATINSERDIIDIDSVAVPYFCPECDEPRTLFVDTSELSGPPFAAPVSRCEVCDLVMQFDDDAKDYFAFMGGRRPKTEPSRPFERPASSASASRNWWIVAVLLALGVAVVVALLLRT